MHAPKVSVIIPTMEEEAVFSLVYSIYKLLGKDTEIIVVDKSSEAYAKRLKETGATVIRQKSNGVERAIMEGLTHARGQILCSIDGDATHDPEGLVKGVELVEADRADLVLGNRLNNLEKGSMNPYIRFGNWSISWLFRTLYKANVHDYLTGLFVMSRKAYDEIKDIEPYRAGAAFFAVDLAKKGYRIREVPIRYYKRMYSVSKLTKSKSAYGANVSAHLIRQVRDYSPLLIFGSVGVVCILAGAIVGILVLINFFQTGLLNEVGRALIAFMLVTIGFLSIIAGLILDLLLEIERKISK